MKDGERILTESFPVSLHTPSNATSCYLSHRKTIQGDGFICLNTGKKILDIWEGRDTFIGNLNVGT